MKRVFTLLAIVMVVMVASAQELKCTVTINSDLISGSNKSVFNTLQKSISEFMNNRRWSELTFAVSEKIECNLAIIIKKADGDSYTGEIQIQSRRPVYNSSYQTTLFNFKDNNFSFDYKEFEQLEMNESTITSNLTAVLAYYAYIIIGYDMDSYSKLGGTPFFEAAEKIVNDAQSSNLSGWKAFESNKNRYALVNNLTDEAFKKYRLYFYDYHRLGLDEMSINMTNARSRIFNGLPILRDANRARPSAILISSFMDAKNDELINIFKKAPDAEKKTAVEILTDINPTSTERYQTILN